MIFNISNYIFNHHNNGSSFVTQPRQIKNASEFINLIKNVTAAGDKNKKVAKKKSTCNVMQPSSSRETLLELSKNSRSERADISILSELTSPTLPLPSRADSEETSRRSKSKEEKSLPRRPKNDRPYLNWQSCNTYQ